MLQNSWTPPCYRLIMLKPLMLRAHPIRLKTLGQIWRQGNKHTKVLFLLSMCIPIDAHWNFQEICDQTPFIFNANRALVMIIWKSVFALVFFLVNVYWNAWVYVICNWYKRKLVDMFQRKIFPVLQLIYSLDQFVCSPWFCLNALHI